MAFENWAAGNNVQSTFAQKKFESDIIETTSEDAASPENVMPKNKWMSNQNQSIRHDVLI